MEADERRYRSAQRRSGPHRVLTLAAVEAVHPHDGGASALGLVFRERPSVDDFRLALAPGTVIRFEDDTGTGDCTT
jgi:hypothetical protein